MNKYFLFEVRVAGLIFNKKNELLLIKNPVGSWGTPIGHMEKNESFKKTLNREVKEETGIKIIILTQMKTQKFGNSIVIPFVCNYKSGNIKLQKEEALDYKWIKINEMKKLKLTFKGLINEAKIGLNLKNKMNPPA
ncbi:MAG: NUDIX domain-containing protein [archaeon]|jgi:NAD+ diphosphatase